MQLIYTITFNTETKELAFTGNTEAQIAFNLLQQIIIAEAIAKEEKK